MFIKWLQDHLLPCPFKYLTGIDCPGCGFQRSVIALIQGDISKSFQLYPPAIPLLLAFAYALADGWFKLDKKKQIVKKTVFIVAASIVLISYSIKIWQLYQHHAGSILAAR